MRSSEQALGFVEYSYVVDGKRYTSDNVGIEISGKSDEKEARRRIFTYPRRKVVEVFYDPANPSYGVLERDVPWWGVALGVFRF